MCGHLRLLGLILGPVSYLRACRQAEREWAALMKAGFRPMKADYKTITNLFSQN